MPARLRTAPWRLQSNKADGAEGCSDPLRLGKRARCWHKCEAPTALRKVRFQGQPGKHMLRRVPKERTEWIQSRPKRPSDGFRVNTLIFKSFSTDEGGC